MSNNSNQASLQFTKPVIKGITTTVGERKVNFDDESEKYDLAPQDYKRLKKVIGLESRHVVSGGETTVDLCEASAQKLLQGLGYSAEDLSGIIFVTQSPDHSAPCSAIALQHRLNANVTTMAFDMRMGCSGFVYGLCTAYSLIESGLDKILLCVGDVASSFIDPLDHTIAPIMGDGGSAILIERGDSASSFQMYSDGSGARALMIPNSGIKKVPEDEGLAPLMQMDGAAVFNFTLQRVPSLVTDMLTYAKSDKDNLDFYVLHQPNRYILKNIQKRLKLPPEKVPMETQAIYGNLNSASIPGTINGFLSNDFSTKKQLSMFAGFGIGLSWAACIVETESIYAPPTFIGVA